MRTSWSINAASEVPSIDHVPGYPSPPGPLGGRPPRHHRDAGGDHRRRGLRADRQLRRSRVPPATSVLWAELRLDLPGDQRGAAVGVPGPLPRLRRSLGASTPRWTSCSTRSLSQASSGGATWTGDIEPVVERAVRARRARDPGQRVGRPGSRGQPDDRPSAAVHGGRPGCQGPGGARIAARVVPDPGAHRHRAVRRRDHHHRGRRCATPSPTSTCSWHPPRTTSRHRSTSSPATHPASRTTRPSRQRPRTSRRTASARSTSR